MYTIRDPLKRSEQLFAGHDAVICGDVRRTYAELGRRVRQVAGLLDTITDPGDRVALWSLNSAEYLELFVGIPCANRAIVPHNTRWAEPELVYATTDAGARVLICDRDPGAMGDIVERVIRLDTGEYEELLASSPELEPGVSPDTLAGLFYTGGTTGASKGVMLTHANLMANAVHTGLVQPLMSDDRYLTMAPMFHAAGVLTALGLIWVGASNVILPTFDPDATLDLIEIEAITCAIAVPAMLAAMVESQAGRARDVSSMRWLSHGASPVAVEVLRRAYGQFGCELIHLYGATELSPLATIFRHEDEFLSDPQRAKSCGQAPPGVSLKICDPEGNEVPTGEVGEVTVRGPNVMSGYWNKPAETEAALDADGWYRTGDLGFLDQEGYVYLVDRSKDMIVSGGENVYCTEVEDVIYTHPGVLEATVFGIPDEKWGEVVHAVVVPRAEADLNQQIIIEHCRGQIGGYKVPKSVSFQDDPLPKSGPGKVLKRTLRAPFWEGQDRLIN
ncbi:MAG: long-chain fatty acid--CoA ligase [Actinomycetia bacterium]|nr:long-chain fatty acid--CoA ligase [Actinomycetes bacterium]